MFRTLVWILVVFVTVHRNPSVSGIAVTLENVARGRHISQLSRDTVIYDALNLNDGDDNTIGHVYFNRHVSLKIDLVKTHTVQHITIKLTGSDYKEVEKIFATLSYSKVPSLPTLNHTFVHNECTRAEKRGSDMYLITLYRCCGKCCYWKFVAKGRYVTVDITKKRQSSSAFGIHDIEVSGQYVSDDRNLAMYQPVLTEHNVSCAAREFIANDAWVDNLYVKITQPPFRWRVDLGYRRRLGMVRIVYIGKWGDSKLVLMNDKGKSFTDRRCPPVRSEIKNVNRICCDVSDLTFDTRWLEIRGTHSLPKMVEVYIFPRSLKLYEDCPIPTIPPPTSPTPFHTTTSANGRLVDDTNHTTGSIYKRAEAKYQVQPSHADRSSPFNDLCLSCAIFMSWYIIR